MPIPPAAFSPLATTKSGASSERSPGSSSRSARRPARPTTSPMKRIAVIPWEAIGREGHTRRMAQDSGETTEPRLPAPPAPQVPPSRVEPVVVPRWVQMVLLPLAIVGAYLVLRAAGKVVLLFTIAGLIALLLNPIVHYIQRGPIPRGAAVSIVMVALLAILTGIGFLLVNPISDQASTFQRNVPHWVDDANRSLSDLQDWLDRKNINLQVKEEGQTALQTLGDRIAGGTGRRRELHARRAPDAGRVRPRAD